MGLYDFTFYDLIRCNALTFKDRPAWLEVEDGRTLTFIELKEQTDRLACGLQQAGIQKGDRVGVLAKNHLEYFLVFGAAAALGAVVLPINWRLSADEIFFNLKDGEPRILFADEEYQGLIRDLKEPLPSVEKTFSLGPAGENFVGERIARYKKPQYVEFVENLPVLDDGSPDRAKVKEMHGGKQ